ncbi:MAG: sugar transferase [Fibrella sp.]|nr:sugar transferase [Armatimonadota bacterium]
MPALWNIFRGDMAIVGPRAVEPDEMPPSDRLRRERYLVRPGVICLWWARQRANIPFEGEAWADRDYVLERSFWGDVGIILRVGWASFYGGATPEEEVSTGRITLLDIPLDNDTMDEAVAHLVQTATMDRSGESPSRAMQVSFVNADCANISCCNLKHAAIGYCRMLPYASPTNSAGKSLPSSW